MVLLYLLLPLALGLNCTEDLLSYSFTECVNSVRSAIFYYKQDCENKALPSPLTNLSCDYDCQPGYFLDVDLAAKKPTCKPCPAGTYSRGGAQRFAGSEKDWLNLDYHFTTSCWILSNMFWVEDSKCTKWHSEDGSYISSGTTSEMTWFESELVYYAHNVKPGNLTVRYRKDSIMHNNFHNGGLYIYLDSQVAYSDSELGRDDWKTVSLALDVGQHEIIVAYEKYNTQDSLNMTAEIDTFEVTGVSHSAFTCTKCSKGSSTAGSSECQVCPSNTYFDTESQTCKNCREDKYSLKGSVGPESCLNRKPCTASDYFQSYTPCDQGKRSKVFLWKSPMICNSNTGVSLPVAEPNIPCDKCSPGHYHIPISSNSTMTECAPCPSGTYATESDTVLYSCTDCPIGTYAPRVLNYSRWDPLPEEFENVCVPMNGMECSLSEGWEISNSELTSGRHIDSDSSLVLTRKVVISEDNAYVQFVYSISNIQASDTRLLFSIDGVVYGSYRDSVQQVTTDKYPLAKGDRVIRWIYRHFTQGVTSPTDLAKIHSIVITGSDEGGAPSCITCPDGYVSSAKSGKCSPCPEGSSSNLDRSQCVVCKDNEYSDREGSLCMPCPAQTYSSKDHTYCLISDNLLLHSGRINVQELSGITPGEGGYGKGICELERLEFYCHETFYGPVMGNNNYFYISVGNPGALVFPTYSRLDKHNKGYVYGVINKQDLQVRESELEIPDDTCQDEFNRMVVNLGSRISYVNATDLGFKIKYTDGALCKLTGDTAYSTEVDFICDKFEGEGWPVYQGQVDCSFKFQWRTKYACRVCDPFNMIEIKGICYGGEREVHLSETSMCRVVDTNATYTWSEECNGTVEVIETWPMIVGLSILVVMMIVSLVLFGFFCKVRNQYQRLIEYREDEPRGIELS